MSNSDLEAAATQIEAEQVKLDKEIQVYSGQLTDTITASEKLSKNDIPWFMQQTPDGKQWQKRLSVAVQNQDLPKLEALSTQVTQYYNMAKTERRQVNRCNLGQFR